MKITREIVFILSCLVITTGCTIKSEIYQGLCKELITAKKDTVISDSIIYHPVRIDQNGNILPWYSANLGESYNHVLNLVWDFWKNMEIDSNGIKYYMNHQVWKPEHDPRGLGGDQIMMALSSWDLFYNYTGDESVIDNMKYMADYYLANSLSPPNSKWPNLPFPYNTNVESGIYDGDMIIGVGFLQPDKAGSFGFELVKLYKKTGDKKYLNAAIKIANTLADNVQSGDNESSPWPFKVNAITGEVGTLRDRRTNGKIKESTYTTNWTGALNLCAELIIMKNENSDAYKKTFDTTLNWLKMYPLKTNKWGPFFEDGTGWSDTQINAVTYAMYVMENRELDPNWEETVRNIFQWVYEELGNKEYEKYGVTCINEQTAYRVPGNSHSSRQASMELMYWEKSGDTTYLRNAVRKLNWATYMVDSDGKNRYPRDQVWLTDGYGDYVRHYLRSMAAAPQLAPDNSNHLLRSSSIVKKILYKDERISYIIFDDKSVDVLRLTTKPKKVQVNGITLKEVKGSNSEGWFWQSLDKGGIIQIKQSKGYQIEVLF